MYEKESMCVTDGRKSCMKYMYNIFNVPRTWGEKFDIQRSVIIPCNDASAYICIPNLFQVTHHCTRLGSEELGNNVDPTNAINNIHKHNGLVHESTVSMVTTKRKMDR